MVQPHLFPVYFPPAPLTPIPVGVQSPFPAVSLSPPVSVPSPTCSFVPRKSVTEGGTLTITLWFVCEAVPVVPVMSPVLGNGSVPVPFLPAQPVSPDVTATM